MCAKQGCGQPAWNGEPGEYCTRSCRDSDLGRRGALRVTGGARSGPYGYGSCSSSCSGRPPLPITIPKPLASLDTTTTVVGFYFPGREDPCDQVCKAAFLGNFWPMGSSGLTLEPPDGQKQRPGWPRSTFTNAEAAFQALKFWHSVDQFAESSGQEAFRRKQDLKGHEDFSYCGYGSNWKAMKAVLEAKFKNPELVEALGRTGGAFLVEHNSKERRDTIWSNNSVGDGQNWLGMQLMLVRGRSVQDDGGWAHRIEEWIDIESGSPKNNNFAQKWQEAVLHATNVVRKATGEESVGEGPANRKQGLPPKHASMAGAQNQEVCCSGVVDLIRHAPSKAGAGLHKDDSAALAGRNLQGASQPSSGAVPQIGAGGYDAVLNNSHHTGRAPTARQAPHHTQPQHKAERPAPQAGPRVHQGGSPGSRESTSRCTRWRFWLCLCCCRRNLATDEPEASTSSQQV